MGITAVASLRVLPWLVGKVIRPRLWGAGYILFGVVVLYHAVVALVHSRPGGLHGADSGHHGDGSRRPRDDGVRPARRPGTPSLPTGPGATE
ncbi:hypothetical protein ACRAWF_25435 [Streptomyces sp. L7]